VGENTGCGQPKGGHIGIGFFVVTIIDLLRKLCDTIHMSITYDPDKRAAILNLWDLDLSEAGKVFEGAHLTVADNRLDFAQIRFITIGYLSGTMVVLAWTARANARHIISIRTANEREQRRYSPRFE
jgi:uncharacterized DUF497 family protein